MEKHSSVDRLWVFIANHENTTGHRGSSAGFSQKRCDVKDDLNTLSHTREYRNNKQESH